jgi:hypothetical protein
MALRGARRKEADVSGGEEIARVMAARAEEVAGDVEGLDYSVASLDYLDRELGPAVMWDSARLGGAAAYVGEVIRRRSADSRWARKPPRVDGPRDEPGIVNADWFADPFDFIRRRCGDPSGASLRDLVGELLSYLAAPTAATERALGWSTWFRWADRRGGRPGS